MSIDVSGYSFSADMEKNNCSLHQPMRCNPSALSDWAVLNGTDVGRLRRLLQGTDGFTLQGIEWACRLIENYHAVYRQDLMQLRRRGCLGRCPSPTSEQLQQIAKSLNEQESQNCSVTDVLAELKTLARQLRAIRSKR
jgi:hypothetical protein